MSFDAKFFLVAVVLSTIAAISRYLNQWILLAFRISPLFYSRFYYVFTVVQLACGVVLPFVIMYTLGKNVDSPSAFKPIMLSIFLGSWVGQVSVFVVNIFVNVLVQGGNYIGWDAIVWLWTVWQLFALALSGVFFVSLAAVLFAYYQKTARETHANT